MAEQNKPSFFDRARGKDPEPSRPVVEQKPDPPKPKAEPKPEPKQDHSLANAVRDYLILLDSGQGSGQDRDDALNKMADALPAAHRKKFLVSAARPASNPDNQ